MVQPNNHKSYCPEFTPDLLNDNVFPRIDKKFIPGHLYVFLCTCLFEDDD